MAAFTVSASQRPIPGSTRDNKDGTITLTFPDGQEITLDPADPKVPASILDIIRRAIQWMHELAELCANTSGDERCNSECVHEMTFKMARFLLHLEIWLGDSLLEADALCDLSRALEEVGDDINSGSYFRDAAGNP